MEVVDGGGEGGVGVEALEDYVEGLVLVSCIDVGFENCDGEEKCVGEDNESGNAEHDFVEEACFKVSGSGVSRYFNNLNRPGNKNFEQVFKKESKREAKM